MDNANGPDKYVLSALSSECKGYDSLPGSAWLGTGELLHKALDCIGNDADAMGKVGATLTQGIAYVHHAVGGLGYCAEMFLK